MSSAFFIELIVPTLVPTPIIPRGYNQYWMIQRQLRKQQNVYVDSVISGRCYAGSGNAAIPDSTTIKYVQFTTVATVPNFSKLHRTQQLNSEQNTGFVST